MPRIKRVELPTDYRSLHFESNKLGEANDCAVVAVALACDVSYAAAHARLVELGRKLRKGTRRTLTENAIRSFGFTVRYWSFRERVAMVDSYPEPHRRVLKSITSHHPRRFPAAWANVGTVLLFSARHVLCFKKGTVLDWSINKALRINEVWEIRKEK